MALDDAHAEMLIAIAHCIHRLHYRVEHSDVFGSVETFDNLCAGPLELAAVVLEATGFTKFLDDLPRRSTFVCLPENFNSVARSKRAQNVDPPQVERTVLRLSCENFASTEEIDRIADQLRNER